MLYKLLICVAVLLCGTPAIAQNVSPLTVETLRESIAPTTVRTGEPFIQVYKISYLSSDKWGKEVVVLEDEMKPKSFPASLENFEILDWSMSKPIITRGEETDEYTRFLTLTLRIINPKKGAYLVPKIQILWAEKVGDKLEGQEPMETDPIDVNYVSTITKDPYLDIRDSVHFEDYSKRANMFWYVSRAGAPFVGLATLLLLARSLRSAKRSRTEESSKKTVDETRPEYSESPPLVFNVAYRNFMRDIQGIAKELSTLKSGEDIEKYLNPKRKLFNLLRDVLASRLENINPGDQTASGIEAYIEKNIKLGNYKEILLRLDKFLALYQKEIESGSPNYVFPQEIANLKSSVRLLKRRWRILAFLGKKA